MLDIYNMDITENYVNYDNIVLDVLIDSFGINYLYLWWLNLGQNYFDLCDINNLHTSIINSTYVASNPYLNFTTFDEMVTFDPSSPDTAIIFKFMHTIMFTILFVINFFPFKNFILPNSNSFIYTKIILISTHLSKLYKFPEEGLILFVLFLYFYMINLMLFNELLVDTINSWNSFGLYIYIICFIIYLHRYNLNFFSFLELSNTETPTYKYLTKQYLRDITNFLAHALRLVLLFLRLNIYDGLDDIFDSYYIFVGDFNIYEYYDMLIIYFTKPILIIDSIYDMPLTRYTESGSEGTPIYVYITILYKIFLFFFFLLEGILRIFLASYIILLLTLEINNFNVVYSEDQKKSSV